MMIIVTIVMIIVIIVSSKLELMSHLSKLVFRGASWGPGAGASGYNYLSLRLCTVIISLGYDY